MKLLFDKWLGDETFTLNPDTPDWLIGVMDWIDSRQYKLWYWWQYSVLKKTPYHATLPYAKEMLARAKERKAHFDSIGFTKFSENEDPIIAKWEQRIKEFEAARWLLRRLEELEREDVQS